MDYELPTEFDLIVVGTGVVESIVAAAASRIGKRVLHVDSNDYYGGVWASFNLDSVHKLTSVKTEQKIEDVKVDLDDEEKFYRLGNDLFDIKDVEQTWHVPEKVEENSEKKENSATAGSSSNEEKVPAGSEPTNKEENADAASPKDTSEESKPDSAKATLEEEPKSIPWSREGLLKESRRFNIDLAPKLQFARGDFVELLISSNIARYSEFRSVSRVLTYLNGKIEIAPCSRADVFSNSNVTVIEKRMLMKLLEACLDGDEDEFERYENKTFKNFLTDRKLTSNLIHYILYAIALSTDSTPCMEGVENTKRFLISLGRFGKTPFLYSMYGSGEVTQAFCRLSAVFGGIYALNQTLHGIVVDKENAFKSIICGKQQIVAKHLVMSVEHAPKDFVEGVEKKYISRAAFITNKTVLDAEKEHLTLLVFPAEKDQNITIEMGCLTGTCPKGTYLVHMFTRQKSNPKEDFKHNVESLFAISDDEVDSVKPKILWSFYHSTPDVNGADLTTNVPKNIFLCPGPDTDLDYDNSVRKAREIFNEIYPNEEFLPRAPDPEEIIIEGEETTNNEASGDAPAEVPQSTPVNGEPSE